MGAMGTGAALASHLCKLTKSVPNLAVMFALTRCPESFCAVTRSEGKSVRKHAAFALGESAPLTFEVINALAALLESEPSVYVRTNSAGALGLIGVRHLASADACQDLLPLIFRALVGCLG
eukprot:SAG31_NODE_18969_length_616_cov_1.125725_1_plen_120_part_10